MSGLGKLLLTATVLSLAGSLEASRADAGDPSGPAERTAWQFTDGGATLIFLNVRPKEWVIDRPDGRTSPYDELDRTERYVELRDRRTQWSFRLHDDRAYRRQGAITDWIPWVEGAWVRIPSPPVAERIAPRDYRVRLAYFVPEDRDPAPNYEAKIRVIATIVADLYRTDLRAKGYATEGVRFVTDGAPVVELIRGSHAASYYNNAPDYNAGTQWQRLLPEITEGLGDVGRRVIVVFAETYDDGPAKQLWPGMIASGAYDSAESGLVIFSAHILRDEFCALSVQEQWERFRDRTPVPGRRAWGHPVDSPRGEFAEDGCGAVAHLLGLALGLPRDQRDDAADLMGNGFRNLSRNDPSDEPRGRRVGFSEENARLLMSSRYLADDLDTTDEVPPVVELRLVAEKGESPLATVQASDNTGLRAIVFCDRDAHTVICGRKLSGKTEEFRERLPDSVVHGGAIKLRAIVTDDGGNQTRVDQELRIR